MRTAPTAWFGVPAGSQRLTPIAILPDETGALQYAPPAGTISWAWNAAKTVVASADDNHHEIISIIYAASALHAAGNFPQANITVYTPLAPGAGYAPVEQAMAVADEAQWLALLPPLDMAALQLRLTYTLGSVHYTQLGRYDLPWFLPTHHNVEIQERLGSFHHKLGIIEASINARNARLPLAFQYPYLLPSQVPQSINI